MNTPTPEETQAALNDSIQHWERMTSGNRLKNERIGVYHCALCKLFYNLRCEGCPISKKTGEAHCNNTPYDGVIYAYNSALSGISPFDDLDESEKIAFNSELFKKAAQKELDFLKTLTI